jgi:membrane protease YdiL (CAAX protease family)
MVFSLKCFFPHLMALATTPAKPFNLSEADLVARYPVLAVAAALFLAVGLGCDLFLLIRLVRRAQSSSTATAGSLLRIEPKPWNVGDVLLTTSLFILLFAVGNSVLAVALKLARVDEEHSTPWFLAVEMLLCGIGVLGMAALFRRRGTDWRPAVGFRPGSSRGALALGGFFFFAVLPPLFAMSIVYDKLCRLAHVEETAQPVVDLLIGSESVIAIGLIMAFAIVVAPVFEELFFRGFAYPALKQRWGPWKALAAVSAVFALVHMHVPSMGPLFVLALGLGLAYELTGSLLTPITMHALFNTANVAMLLYVRAHS